MAKDPTETCLRDPSHVTAGCRCAAQTRDGNASLWTSELQAPTQLILNVAGKHKITAAGLAWWRELVAHGSIPLALAFGFGFRPEHHSPHAAEELSICYGAPQPAPFLSVSIIKMIWHSVVNVRFYLHHNTAAPRVLN
jgi:hypothetical protein